MAGMSSSPKHPRLRPLSPPPALSQTLSKKCRLALATEMQRLRAFQCVSGYASSGASWPHARAHLVGLSRVAGGARSLTEISWVLRARLRLPLNGRRWIARGSVGGKGKRPDARAIGSAAWVCLCAARGASRQPLGGRRWGRCRGAAGRYGWGCPHPPGRGALLDIPGPFAPPLG
eukprot:356602-Chlamydomonas_euryale.AAC.17